MVATGLHCRLVETIYSFMIKLGPNDIENQNKACDYDESQVHV